MEIMYITIVLSVLASTQSKGAKQPELNKKVYRKYFDIWKKFIVSLLLILLFNTIW